MSTDTWTHTPEDSPVSLIERPTQRVPVWTVLALLCALVGVAIGVWLLAVPHADPVLVLPLMAGNASVAVIAWRWRH